MAKLTEEEIVTIRVLHSKGEAKTAIARRLEVTEGTVRYHLRRGADAGPDGRAKPFLVEQPGLEAVVERWWEDELQRCGAERPPSVLALQEYLMAEQGYSGSYKSVWKYVRSRFAAPKKRPFRRMETPPGAQSQSDWAERTVDIEDPTGPTALCAFVMTLSHSRKSAVIWSRSQNQLAWHHVHNEAYRRLEGVAAVNRIDNLKTGIATGAGPWGCINAQYRSYARQMRFHVDAHEPGQPQQKGKVERHVRLLDRLGLEARPFEGLAELQAWTDRRVEAIERERLCPATGQTVHESWQAEKAFLGPLPACLPEPFDLIQTRPVHRDCTVRTEGRSYAVPFAYLDRRVEVRGTAEEIQVFDPSSGALLVRYPRGTAERILIDPSCYEGEATERVLPPRPLGAMARKLQHIAALPVQARPIDLYAALAEVAR